MRGTLHPSHSSPSGLTMSSSRTRFCTMSWTCLLSGFGLRGRVGGVFGEEGGGREESSLFPPTGINKYAGPFAPHL